MGTDIQAVRVMICWVKVLEQLVGVWYDTYIGR